MSADSLARDLAAVSARVSAMLSDHLTLHTELLAHVFLGGELRPYIYELLMEPGSAASANEVRKLLDVLERHCRLGGNAMRDLIAVGFLEGTPTSPEPGAEIRAFLGPALQEELAKLESG